MAHRCRFVGPSTPSNKGRNPKSENLRKHKESILLYSKELKQAVIRSLNAKLIPPGFSVRTKNVRDKKFHEIIDGLELYFWEQIDDGFITSDKFRVSCLRTSEVACGLLRDARYPCLLTLGNVSKNGQKLFKCDADNVIAEVSNSASAKDTLELHAWLTVGNRIIDPTIIPFCYPDPWGKRRIESFVHYQDVSSSARSNEFEYHPLLCGEPILPLLLSN